MTRRSFLTALIALPAYLTGLFTLDSVASRSRIRLPREQIGVSPHRVRRWADREMMLNGGTE